MFGNYGWFFSILGSLMILIYTYLPVYVSQTSIFARYDDQKYINDPKTTRLLVSSFVVITRD